MKGAQHYGAIGLGKSGGVRWTIQRKISQQRQNTTTEGTTSTHHVRSIKSLRNKFLHLSHCRPVGSCYILSSIWSARVGALFSQRWPFLGVGRVSYGTTFWVGTGLHLQP